jgi:hypothetical protein
LPGEVTAARSKGAIAQLGERLLCKQEVVGSIPSGSTRLWCETEVNVQASKSNSSAADQASGYLDIVKKGYARDVGSRQSPALVPAHRDRSRRRLSSLGLIACVLGALGSLTASLGSGLSRCNWSFYRRCSPCRVRAGDAPTSKVWVAASSLRWALLMRAIK